MSQKCRKRPFVVATKTPNSMAVPRPCIVDTNVAIAANGSSPQASSETQVLCIDALLEITRKGGLVLDNQDRIFQEYSNKLSFAGQPGTGDLFLKWVHDYRWNAAYCELRPINCVDEADQKFEEFPSHPQLENFDKSDRKFIATANAGKAKVPILQAVDFKWWGWKDALAATGIHIHFINPTEAEAGYRAHIGNAR